jgi:hypothetical protein
MRMKKLVVTLFAVVVTGSTLLGLLASTAQSRPQYFKEFREKYVKPDGSPDEQAFAAEVKSAKCLVCHEGTSKKDRNSYGKELAKLLKPEDAPANFKGETDKTKINEALEKVAEMHVDPNDPKSPTYGDLIKEGKLPAGEKK